MQIEINGKRVDLNGLTGLTGVSHKNLDSTYAHVINLTYADEYRNVCYYMVDCDYYQETFNKICEIFHGKNLSEFDTV